jgi:phosphate transport system substrate-binding protein
VIVPPTGRGRGPGPSASSPPRRVVRRRPDRGRLYAGIFAAGIVAALLATGPGSGWYGLVGAPSSGECPTGITLQGAGASFPQPLESLWASGFAGQTGDQVNYAASGAGQGITLLTERQVDFALTDEPLNASETAGLHGAVGTVLTLPVTGGAVGLVYDLPGYSGPLNLTAAEVAGLFNGTLAAWDSPTLVANNPGLSSVTRSVYAVEREDPAGMSYVLTNFLSDGVPWWSDRVGTSIQPAWPAFPRAIQEAGNSAVLEEVAGQAGTIGYTDLYDAEIRSLPTALLEDPLGAYVAATPESAGRAVNDTFSADPGGFPAADESWAGVSFVDANGTGAYPLATLVYALVPEDLAEGHAGSLADAKVVGEWLRWVLTSGGSFNETAFPYVDPPAGLVTEALQALSEMNYGGASLGSCA